MLVRPESLKVEALDGRPPGDNELAGDVLSHTFLGPVTRLKVVGTGRRPDRGRVDGARRLAAGRVEGGRPRAHGRHAPAQPGGRRDEPIPEEPARPTECPQSQIRTICEDPGDAERGELQHPRLVVHGVDGRLEPEPSRGRRAALRSRARPGSRPPTRRPRRGSRRRSRRAARCASPAAAAAPPRARGAGSRRPRLRRRAARACGGRGRAGGSGRASSARPSARSGRDRRRAPPRASAGRRRRGGSCETTRRPPRSAWTSNST